MPYTEEVLQDYKTRLDCKNRACPMQDYFEDKTKGKRYFKYQCKDVKLWAVCLRWKDPAAKAAKPAQPAEPTKPTLKHKCHFAGCSFETDDIFLFEQHLEGVHKFAVTPPPAPAPTENKSEIGGFPCSRCSYLAPSQFLLNKHMDFEHSSQGGGTT